MAPKVSKGGTGKFIKQGHTAGAYGNEPNVTAKGEAGKPARELSV